MVLTKTQITSVSKYLKEPSPRASVSFKEIGFYRKWRNWLHLEIVLFILALPYLGNVQQCMENKVYFSTGETHSLTSWKYELTPTQYLLK